MEAIAWRNVLPSFSVNRVGAMTLQTYARSGKALTEQDRTQMEAVWRGAMSAYNVALAVRALRRDPRLVEDPLHYDGRVHDEAR